MSMAFTESEGIYSEPLEGDEPRRKKWAGKKGGLVEDILMPVIS